jgi:hypothetical protein
MSVVLDHGEIRDCALLVSAVYFGTEIEVGTFLAHRGHRFNGGITCSNIANSEGHFVIAQLRAESRTTTYLAVRGSFILEDWGANVQAWPTLQGMGMVHAGWYARMLHLPQHLLVQCIKEGHRVVICGHSLGGAVAQLLTLAVLQSFAGDAAEIEIRSRVKCVSFAGPMVMSGNVAINHVNDHFKDSFVNFVHSTDIVPKILSFAQAALKDFSSQQGKQRSVTSLVTMLHTVVDPTAFGQLTIQSFAGLVKAGTAALLQSTAVRVALSYRPIGHYYKIDGSAGTPLTPQTAAELEELVAWHSVELSTDAVHAHSMEGIYLQAILSKLDSSATGSIVRTEPPSLLLPRPVIHRVDLHRTGRQILVRIFGANLYMVKSVASSALPLCALDHRVSAKALVSAEQLMFTVEPSPANYAKERAVSATTVAQLMALPGLCWKDTIVFPSIPVRVVDTHPMDLFSLQELVMAAIYLLLFVSREQGHYGHPKFSVLRKLLKEILVTIPLSVYFSSSSPVVGYCVEKHADIVVPILLQQRATREALRDYISQGDALYDTLKDHDEAQALHDHLDALRRLYSKAAQGTPQSLEVQPHNILSLLALCHDPPSQDNEEGLKVLLEVLGGPLHHARAALQAELTPQTYRAFLGALAVGLSSSCALTVALGKYYNPAQTELGPLNDALSVFLNNPTVRIAMQVVSKAMVAGGGAAGLMFFGNLIMWMCVTGAVFNPAILVTYLGLALVGGLLVGYFGRFPARVLRSSSGLRDAVVKHLKISVAAGANVGEVESILANHLKVTRGYDPCSNAKGLRQLVSDCFPYVDDSNEEYPDVLRRLKLTVLCAALRDALKQLPVALVTGPTRSGKSTFREHMQNREPNRQNYGPQARQRTSVPELFFCGEANRPIGLLDSIGLGDPTSNEVFAAIEQANKIFRLFCQASVIVVNESDTSAAGRNLMYHTSVVQPRTPPPHATSAHHPTITCFTNADKMLDVGGIFPEGDGAPATLLQEAKDRVVRGEPFDLRSPQEDPFAPRVLACFEGRIQLPEEYNGVVYTTAQVREWIYSHFYPKR